MRNSDQVGLKLSKIELGALTGHWLLHLLDYKAFFSHMVVSWAFEAFNKALLFVVDMRLGGYFKIWDL